MSRSYKRLINNIVIILSFILLMILCMHESLSTDESFTLSLIHKDWPSIIKLDSIDVQPPLYYLLLKSILNITTFWTQNIIIKVIVARLFSLLCLFISFDILCKILIKMNINYNKIYLYIIFIITILWQQQATNIRMYPLSVLLLSLDFLFIISYIYSKNPKYIVGITAVSILLSYTHDFMALISCILIFLLFMHKLYKYHKLFNYELLSGMCIIIAYMPWMGISIYQIKHMPQNYWITYLGSLKNLTEFIFILIIIFIFIFYFKSYINKKALLIYDYLLKTCVFFIFIILIFSLYKPIFMLRYAYPLLAIYLMISCGLLYHIYMKISMKNKKKFIFLLIIGIILGVNIIYNDYNYQKEYHEQSNELYSTFRTCNRNIHLDINKITKFNANENADNLCSFNTYAQYNNDKLSYNENHIIITNKSLKKGTSPYLMYKIWKTRN